MCLGNTTNMSLWNHLAKNIIFYAQLIWPDESLCCADKIIHTRCRYEIICNKILYSMYLQLIWPEESLCCAHKIIHTRCGHAGGKANRNWNKYVSVLWWLVFIYNHQNIGEGFTHYTTSCYGMGLGKGKYLNLVILFIFWADAVGEQCYGTWGDLPEGRSVFLFRVSKS